jgi:hypothetical protein
MPTRRPGILIEASIPLKTMEYQSSSRHDSIARRRARGRRNMIMLRPRLMLMTGSNRTPVNEVWLESYSWLRRSAVRILILATKKCGSRQGPFEESLVRLRARPFRRRKDGRPCPSRAAVIVLLVRGTSTCLTPFDLCLSVTTTKKKKPQFVVVCDRLFFCKKRYLSQSHLEQ